MKGLLVVCIYLFTVVTSVSSLQRKGKTCGNMTLSGSSLSSEEMKLQLTKLQNCSVIEGNLVLHWLDLGFRRTFPDLIQITGYLMLHYVKGFSTLADLFPLLTVIRGHELFHGFGLVLVGNSDIEEVGPWNFHSLIRGSVAMEDNFMMCTEPLKQWNKYTCCEYRRRNYFKNNFEDCPFANCEEEGYCSVRKKTCHRNQNCFTDEECHSECIGGCRKPNDANFCAACKNLVLDGKCVAACPNTHYEYLNYRCITQNKCESLKWTVYVSIEKKTNTSETNVTTSESSKVTTSYINRSCVKTCPPPSGQFGKCGSKWSQSESTTCAGSMITRENMGDHLRFCSIIDGNLEIMVSGGIKISHRLRTNLGGIVKITGYLSITASNSLYSLQFLSSLRIIEGGHTKYRNCSFCVLENQNLKEFWPWKTRKTRLTIKGGIYVGYNDHLSEEEINRLIFNTDSDRSQLTEHRNGRKAPSKTYISTLNILPDSMAFSAKMTWFHNFTGNDNREIDGYFIYYRMTKEIVTKFEDRDACNDLDDIWKRIILDIPDYGSRKCEDRECKFYELQKLLPNTRYAVYVRTFSISKEYRPIETDIAYVTTSPIYPDDPKNGKVERSNGSRGEIYISWDNVEASSEILYEVSISVQKELGYDWGLYFNESCPLFNEELKVMFPGEKPLSPKSGNFSNGTNMQVEYQSSCTCPNVDLDEYFKAKHTYQQLDNAIGREHIVKHRIATRTKRDNTCGPVRCQDELFVNWKDYDLKMERIFQIDDWKRSQNGFIYEKIYLTKENHLNVQLPQDLKWEDDVKINVSVRAYTSEQTPCVALSKNYSCALCSNHHNWTTHLLDNEEDLTDVTFSFHTTKFNYFLSMDDRLFNCENTSTFDHNVQYQLVDAPLDNNYASNDLVELEVAWNKPKDSLQSLVLGYRIQYYFNEHSSLDKGLEICVSGNKLMIPLSSPWKHYWIRLQVQIGADLIWSKPKCVQFEESRFIEYSAWAIVLIAGLAVVAMGISSVISKKNKQVTTDNVYYGSGKNDIDYKSCNFRPDLWIKWSEMSNLKKLSDEGHFGCVYTADFGNKVVAVKTTKTTPINNDNYITELEALLQDVKILQDLQSYFIIDLIGICKNDSKNGQQFYVILEFMDQKDLKTYISKRKSLTEKTMIEILVQISDGMSYLVHHKIVHKDLAARNIFVDSRNEKFTPLVKIGDFGLSRSIEKGYYRHDGSSGTEFLPARHIAPESISKHLYNEKSDVWSFGIVIFEILTECDTPYKGVSESEVVLKVPLDLIKLQKCPENSSKFLLELLDNCCFFESSKRDCFRIITNSLFNKTSDDFQEMFRTESFTLRARSSRDSESTEGFCEEVLSGSSRDNSVDDDVSSSRGLLSFQNDENSSQDTFCLSLNCVHGSGKQQQRSLSKKMIACE